MTPPLPIQEVLETFPALALPGMAHGLVRRVPGVSVSLDKMEVLALLKPWHEAAVAALGFDQEHVFTSEQIHEELMVTIFINGSLKYWIFNSSNS